MAWAQARRHIARARFAPEVACRRPETRLAEERHRRRLFDSSSAGRTALCDVQHRRRGRIREGALDGRWQRNLGDTRRQSRQSEPGSAVPRGAIDADGRRRDVVRPGVRWRHRVCRSSNWQDSLDQERAKRVRRQAWHLGLRGIAARGRRYGGLLAGRGGCDNARPQQGDGRRRLEVRDSRSGRRWLCVGNHRRSRREEAVCAIPVERARWRGRR